MDQVPSPSQEISGEIPDHARSPVASRAHWNAPLLVLVTAIAVLIVYVLKAPGRVSAPSVPSTPEVSAPFNLPAGIQTNVPPAILQHDDTQSLWELRQKSPMVLLNTTSSEPTAPLNSDAEAPGLPMPQGFHPTLAPASHSSTLGDREFIIGEGKLLDAVLESAISTDHAGLLRALVSQDIYGDTGRTVLLPRGSRLIGQYDAEVAQGQDRVYVIWQRVIRPDGVDIRLDSEGTDALGESGVQGKVNHHFMAMFGAATLLSMIGATASTVGVQPTDNANSLATYRSSVSQGFNDAASNVLGVFVRIKPTLTVHAGAAIKVFVARDLYFDPAQVSTDRILVMP